MHPPPAPRSTTSSARWITLLRAWRDEPYGPGVACLRARLPGPQRRPTAALSFLPELLALCGRSPRAPRRRQGLLADGEATGPLRAVGGLRRGSGPRLTHKETR